MIPENKKKRIGILSGSFNPVHKGHVQLAEYILEHNLVDEIWMVVSPQNPLKTSLEMVSQEMRLKMVELAIQGIQKIKASDVEFSLPVPSYTIDTLNHLSARYPEKEFILIIGSDNALVFDQWKNPELILEHYPVIVYPRKDYDFDSLKQKYPQMQLIDSPLFEVSSTEIRKFIRRGQSVSYWVHPQVQKFIDENGLYR